MNNKKMITDTESTVKYKVVNVADGAQLSIEDSRNLAEMFVNGLPPELKESCKIVPVTEDNKQVLFG